jgi:hypothetical protein
MNKQVPMIFNQEMVAAILSGLKTVTRRPINYEVKFSEKMGFGFKDKSDTWWMCGLGFSHENTVANFVKSKSHIQAGDLIWVRETFCCGRYEETDAEHPDDRNLYIEQCNDERNYTVYRQEALESKADIDEVLWKPSIHMPKKSSRITLRVKSVSVERIQDITDEQAVREGVPNEMDAKKMAGQSGLGWYQKPRVWFKGLWDRNYANWSDNPFVWVIEFELIDKNILKVAE